MVRTEGTVEVSKVNLESNLMKEDSQINRAIAETSKEDSELEEVIEEVQEVG